MNCKHYFIYLIKKKTLTVINLVYYSRYYKIFKICILLFFIQRKFPIFLAKFFKSHPNCINEFPENDHKDWIKYQVKYYIQ